jgi:hypothetical protein
VQGEALEEVPGLKTPDDYGSLRRLHPFIAWSKPPEGAPLIAALQHTRSLVQLHPGSNEVHAAVCDWMDRQLETSSFLPPVSGRQRGQRTVPRSSDRVDALERAVLIVSTSHNSQFDFIVRTKAKVRRAIRAEAQLFERYEWWLKARGRKLEAATYGSLRCDGYEKETGNLIEAKSSASREHIRMAVGQLLDYAFQGRKELGEVYKAILVPKKPGEDIERWLRSIEISLIWPNRGVFLDNANARFTYTQATGTGLCGMPHKLGSRQYCTDALQMFLRCG